MCEWKYGTLRGLLVKCTAEFNLELFISWKNYWSFFLLFWFHTHSISPLDLTEQNPNPDNSRTSELCKEHVRSRSYTAGSLWSTIVNINKRIELYLRISRRFRGDPELAIDTSESVETITLFYLLECRQPQAEFWVNSGPHGEAPHLMRNPYWGYYDIKCSVCKTCHCMSDQSSCKFNFSHDTWLWHHRSYGPCICPY